MGKSQPSAPDPVRTAQAQAGMNRDTAITQQQLNMIDQYNPYGSTTYQRTGEDTFVDSQGKTVSTPKYSQTVTLSPEQQAILDQTQGAQRNTAELANQQSAFMKDYLAKPFEFNNQDAADWAYDLASSRILPQQQKNQDALRAQLINSGIRPGTAAWDTEMTRLTNANTDQMNQLMLTGRSQAFNEAMATRSQPINELAALLSGSQVTNPGTASPGAPQSQVAGVDYTGLVNQKYQAEMQQYNAGMGGMFGLAGTALGAGLKYGLPLLSDERAKEDIRKIGETLDGQNLYTYRYKGEDTPQIGLLAQEVERRHPEAVGEIDGLKFVDYARAIPAMGSILGVG